MSLTICFADIHINTTKYPEYEAQKVQRIRQAIKMSSARKIVFSGDTFDRNRPTMSDIKLFYSLIDGLDRDRELVIIAGNHDHTVFDYLPHVGFKYYSEITVVDDVVYIPWAKIHENFPDGSICYSHARCTIPPHIVEEVSMDKFSERYTLTILGDIHSPMEPRHNVVYTSSPVPIHFKNYQKNSTGYLMVDEEKQTYTRHFINDLAKIKVTTTTHKIHDTIAAMKKTSGGNIYKVVVEDYPEKLVGIQKWATAGIKIEPKVILHKQDVYDKVKEVLDQSLSIEEILYSYLKDNYKGYSADMENELKRNIHA